MTLYGLLSLYATLLGLIVGSYLNVLIYRLPRGLSTVFPASRCPRCQAPIRPWHNIPVLGYLALRGRCRVCREPIPWRYPVIEAVCGGAFLASFRIFGPTLDALAAAAFCAAMLVLAVLDLEHRLLPDRITLPGVALGLLLAPWVSWTGLLDAAGGAALGAATLGALSGLWYLAHRRSGMGMGDVKMAAMIGAFLGWRGVLVTLAGGSVLGSLVALAGMLGGRFDRQAGLPYGAFLAPAAVAALFWGSDLIRIYYGLPAAAPGSR